MNRRIVMGIAVAGILAVAIVFRLFQAGCSAPRAASSPSAQALLAEARKAEGRNDWDACRTQYQKLVAEFPNAREVGDWQRKIEDLNIRLLFSPVPTAQSLVYEIKAGDSLEKIARQYRTTVELLIKSNNLKNENIYPGMQLKVSNAVFSIVVDKSQNTLILKSNDEVFKTYTVATGTNNSTPVGTFSIVEKIVNPPWYKPGGGVAAAGSPENILGTRWMGLNKEGYGIHGTTEPQSLGKQATAGCVRMLNAEVEQLYSIVPQGAEVTIVD